METRMIGSLHVSAVGLGCNNFGRRVEAERARRVVAAALQAGVNFFDTADVYGDGASEEMLGAALAGRREEAVIATKFGGDMPEGSGARPEWIRKAVDGSLRRLGVERIDLYQQHRPDDDVPIAETLGALTELVDAGKVAEIGCSNFSADQIQEAMAASDREGLARFTSVQNRYSVLTPEPEQDGVAAACARHGIGIIPYFPLESGLLSGKYTADRDPGEGRLLRMPPDRRQRFMADWMVQATEHLTRFARDRDRSILELAVSYLLAQPQVASVIAGATRPEQVRANAAAADWRMSEEELTAIRRLVDEVRG